MTGCQRQGHVSSPISYGKRMTVPLVKSKVVNHEPYNALDAFTATKLIRKSVGYDININP